MERWICMKRNIIKLIFNISVLSDLRTRTNSLSLSECEI